MASGPQRNDGETIRVRFKNPGHLNGDMSGLEYFKLFWWPILGRDCAALYELLWFSICGHLRGAPMLTRQQVVAILSLENYDVVRPLVQHLKVVGLVEQTQEALLLVNPVPRISDRMYDESLHASLQALHDQYADRMQFPRRAGESYIQPSLLADAVPPPPPVLAHVRSVVPEAPKLVEFFICTIQERLKAPDFALRERAKNIKIAHSMLKKYDYDEAILIIKAYLADEYRARHCASLASIAAHADMYLNIARGALTDNPARSTGRHSRVIQQEGSITEFGRKDEW